MKDLLNNDLYLANLKEYSKYPLNWKKLANKKIMISGATGLIGRYLIDLIMYKNINENLNCQLVALVRNEDKAKDIFKSYLNDNNFIILKQDVKEAINYDSQIDYIIHAASNTYPIQYATDPVGTVLTNVLGTYNLLNFGKEHNITNFVFTSSFEVYGNVKDNKPISELDFGIVNPTILRSCYPESKRTSESLCIGFSEQYHVKTNIVRLSRVFGPTMNIESSLATAQFLKKGLNKEDIVLKSDGEQLYSYNYVGDAVIAILLVMLEGQDKEAYNVADSKFDAKLKEFAHIVADYVDREVVFDLPDEIEKKGFSNSTMTILNSNKLKELGWHANKDIKKRIEETIDILK